MKDTGWAVSRVYAFWVDLLKDDPLTATAMLAAMVALATTPLAFAVLGRVDWFKARRGRVLQKPEFMSVVAAMILVMGIPAIFLALAVKSRHYDKDRYEFDPNKTWSVLEQGRGYKSLKEADAAVKVEMERLATERKNLVNTVKKLDEAMLTLRAAAVTSSAVAQAIPNVLERLAKVRQSVGVDGPQQLMDFTAPPVEIAALGPAASNGSVTAAPAAPALKAPSAPPSGLTKAQREAELASVPAPQKPLAAFLPLVDIPMGWTVGKSGEKFVETFNAENLFEKIDGRAESFVDFKVKGMAYTYYHPTGDETNEVQVYIFELGDTLKALGKYGTEKPDKSTSIEVGAEGYTTAGSTLFYSGPYYTQMISTSEDSKFAAFALEMARRIAAAQKPGGATPALASNAENPGEGTAKPKPAATGGPSTPEELFALLPKSEGRANQSYVPADVFGYAFLTDVFLAEYTEGKVAWKGFLRPYASVEEAKAAFESYLKSVKQDGADIKEEKAEGADRMVVVSNIGLIDVFFLKGNTLGGAAGATEAKPALEFAKGFAKTLPGKVPMIAGEK